MGVLLVLAKREGEECRPGENTAGPYKSVRLVGNQLVADDGLILAEMVVDDEGRAWWEFWGVITPEVSFTPGPSSTALRQVRRIDRRRDMVLEDKLFAEIRLYGQGKVQ